MTSASATQVIVVQHAEKQPAAGDPGLTERGTEQARRIADLLSGTRIDALLSSPLLRARQTATPLAEAAGSRSPSTTVFVSA